MKTGRRHFLGLAAAGAMLPLAGAVRAAPGFAPPPAPMRYTRRLRRDLVDGAAVVTSRTFVVRFVALGDGYRLEGEQVGEAEVTGPPSLEAFLRLERARRESSLFPLRLDGAGRIVGEPGAAGSAQLGQAIDEALHRIAAASPGADEQLAMRTFVAGLQQAAGSLMAAPPADLFHPLSAPLSESREVVLPDGTRGQVTVTFTARLDAANGVMREAERRVLTRLAESRRHTVESWTLAPAES